MSHAFMPTAAEIGNPFEALERARAFRARMYQQPKKEAPKPKPKITELVFLVGVKPRPKHELDCERYNKPILGPCQPDKFYFCIYNGQRDILNIATPAETRPTVADCIRWAAFQTGFTYQEIIGPRRKAHIVRARQSAMYIAKIHTIKSFPEIGRIFGKRDHTTVLHGVRRAKALVDSGEWVPPTYEEMMEFKARTSGK